jgi:hypothetical protein
MVPISGSKSASVAGTRVFFADCQHFYGGSIGRHGGSIERWSRRW